MSRPLFGLGEIREVVEMLRYRSLDVRSVTLHVDSRICYGAGGESEVAACLEELVAERGRRLRDSVRAAASELGVEVTTIRIALSPFEHLAAVRPGDAGLLVEAARAVERGLRRAGVDYAGGFAADAGMGIGRAAETVIEALPRVMAETERLMGFVSVGSSFQGVSVDAVRSSIEALLEAVEAAGSPMPGARFLLAVNVAPDTPFLPAAHHGPGVPDGTLTVAISGPSVVAAALSHLEPGDPLERVYDEAARVGFKVARLGRAVLEKAAEAGGFLPGGVDLSLAPTPEPGDSVAEVLKAIGAEPGAPGSIAALAVMAEALKRGGGFASCCIAGYSGAMIPVMEDSGLAEAAGRGLVTVHWLLAALSVCSTGLDMVPVPAGAGAERLAALALDALVVGVVSGKTLGVRLVPVPGAEPGDVVELGGLLGSARVMDPGGGYTVIAGRRGRLPPPLRRLLAG